MSTKNWTEQAAEIEKLARERGVVDDFFFSTTFARYKTQITLLNELTAALRDDMMSRRGEKNMSSFIRVSEAANRTVGVLLKILEGGGERQPADDDLASWMSSAEKTI